MSILIREVERVKSICALMNEEWALLLERIFMTEKNTIMERLFHTLDEKQNP